MAHKKHIKKRRRSPIRFLFLFIILIAALIGIVVFTLHSKLGKVQTCLLYTSDAADEEDSVDLGGRRIIKKKKNKHIVG